MGNILEVVKDVNDHGYLSIKFDKESISSINKYTDELRSYVDDEERFWEMINNQKKRDVNIHHCTILNSYEIGKLKKINNDNDVIDDYVNIEIGDFNIIGLGYLTDDKLKDNQAFFLVCESKEVDKFRKHLGFGSKSLHITLGFDIKDIFNGDKDKSSLINIQKVNKKQFPYLIDNL